MNLLNKPAYRGFTIVELLIVVVVIAILAAITIVAYNGITQRVVTASMQSDLRGVVKILENDRTVNGASTYPLTLTSANNGKGVNPSNGAIFNYVTNNLTSPASYCLSISKSGSNTYFVDQNGKIKMGTCVGLVAAGNIVNFDTNPSFEAGLTKASVLYSDANDNSAGNIVVTTEAAHSGSSSLKLSLTNIDSTNGFQILPSSIPVVSEGMQTYTLSAYMRTPRAGISARMDCGYKTTTNDGGPTITVSSGTCASGSAQAIPVNVWTRLSTVANIDTKDTSTGFTIIPQIIATSSSVLTTSDVFYFDSYMVTKSSSLQTYADGNSPGWAWSGVQNASASGPTL